MRPSIALLLGLFLSTEAFLQNHNSWAFRRALKSGFKRTNDFEEKWITQKVDNFNPEDKRTWQMRYQERSEYFKPGGPILIFVGGEWPQEWLPMISEGQHIADMAKELGAMLFYTEHRYYGKSRPVPNTIISNLLYQSIDQALADLAHFITEMKDTRPELKNANVALLGASYSGTMASYFREKFPYLAQAAWVSGAPLEVKPTYEYKEIASVSLELLGGKECVERIREAYAFMESSVASGNTSRFEKEMRLCTPVDPNNIKNIWSLFSQMSNDINVLVAEHETTEIQDTCAVIVDPKYEDGFAGYAAWTWKFSEGLRECYDYDWEPLIELITQTDWEAPANILTRPWVWQMCTDLSNFQTSDFENQPFGSSFPLDFYIGYCNDAYNISLTEDRVKAHCRRHNLIYGGKTPQITNVYYTHGFIDPWKGSGCAEDINEDAPCVFLPNVGHVKDMGSISPSDSPEMKESKERVTSLFRKWLKVEN